jgi:hypothetical protein
MSKSMTETVQESETGTNLVLAGGRTADNGWPMARRAGIRRVVTFTTYSIVPRDESPCLIMRIIMPPFSGFC